MLDLFMNIDPDFVLHALLQHNFLPTQNKHGDEMPPILVSNTFSTSVAQELMQVQHGRRDDYPGFDAVEYKLTRFNGVPRVLSIPHPRAHAELALRIHEYWRHLDHIASNEESLIRPRNHRDGRLIIMNYEQRRESTRRSLNSQFGKRFIAKTDISNFFPSIYSHSIPWALVGLGEAKRNRSSGRWYNKLDTALRLTKRNETQGVAIGPATSNVFAEVILERVDRALRQKDFTYSRFNDDYTAYCATEDQALTFISQLGNELAKYKLSLNINKTEYLRLPRPLEDDWVFDLTAALPGGRRVSSYDATSYLNRAVELADKRPGGSVLKYALRALLRRPLDPSVRDDVLSYALNLAFHQPVLLPLLRGSFPASTGRRGEYPHARKLQMLAYEHGRFDRSDAVSWALYLSKEYQVRIEEECVDQIVRSRDCVPLLLLYLSGDPTHQERVVEFAVALATDDLYVLDQYWLLLYQLFFENKISNPYPPPEDRTFEIMKREGVSFVTTS